jgi:acyl-coenzyme A thioesterase PaaI-like protein
MAPELIDELKRLFGTAAFISEEFKIHLLRPARGERLECVARVLKPGRLFTIVESEVYCESSQHRTLVSKAMATIANVPKSTL